MSENRHFSHVNVLIYFNIGQKSWSETSKLSKTYFLDIDCLDCICSRIHRSDTSVARLLGGYAFIQVAVKMSLTWMTKEIDLSKRYPYLKLDSKAWHDKGDVMMDFVQQQSLTWHGWCDDGLRGGQWSIRPSCLC